VYDATYAKIDEGEENPGYFTQLYQPAYSLVVSIEISKLPKTEYTEGEDFSAVDGYLVMNYDNGYQSNKILLSEATITGYDKTKIGEQILKVEYNGFETELKVTVKANQPTPVSSISATQSSIKVWSSLHSIFIESVPDTKYTIIDLNGRTIKSATTKSTKDEISIDKSGVFVVVINGESFKVAVQ
ncbi:MAG: bacterial Ig-like domain-containing protein, partial [Bacteroidales bacterium]|nr:bacterial Ig-like domain-containing protein [Bacteroidales bacterium]